MKLCSMVEERNLRVTFMTVRTGPLSVTSTALTSFISVYF